MSTSKIPVGKQQTGFRWGLLALSVTFGAGALAVAVEKPVGSIAGRIALEQEGFHLSTYDIRGNRVYVLAVGPNGGNVVERGAWVKPDGTFRINQLPVGEYHLSLRAPGFATANQDGVFVDEARVAQLKTAIHLQIAEPSVNIASNSRVFTTREAPSFWLNANNSTEATVRIYPKSILSLMQAKIPQGLEFGSGLNLYKPYQQTGKRLFATEKPLQTLTRKLTTDLEDATHAEFKLNKPLPSGEYLAVAEVRNLRKKHDWNVMWFSVSDLGLVIKQAPDKTVIRAVDLNTLQPLGNVDVRLLNRQALSKKPFMQGKTGSDGFVTFPIPAQQQGQSNYNWLALGTLGVQKAFGGIDYWNAGRNGYQTYFYTERPIYRLGQTVYFKGIARRAASNGWITPKAGLPLKITVEDPDNSKLWEGKLIANDHGTFHGTYAIPTDGKTGAYQLNIHYPDGTDSYERFEVAQYRKPEYQVDVTPINPRIIAGGKAKARIRATYYFGAPVANARIKYTIYADTDWAGRYQLMQRPEYESYFDDWEDSYQDSSYAGDFVKEGYAQTDATGEATVEYDAPALKIEKDQPFSSEYRDKRYTVQAEVTDLSRIAVVGSGTQAVSAGNFTLFIQPTNYVSKAGSPVHASVLAVDYNGRPVPNRTVTVSLTRWVWDRAREEYKGVATLGSVSVTTDAQGKANITLPTTDRYFTDGYYLTAEAQDEGGHRIYDETGIWIASENSAYVREGQSAQQEAFSVKLDKKAYQPGETARVMITAPVTGKEHSQVIVAVEGAKLHQVWTVPMDATAKLVEIPLKAAFEPNVYVTATLVGPKKQFYNQSELIKVSPAQHFLKLSVNSDKTKYKPGETAHYTVKATYPNGKPAANTEVSLGVVDESIYAIRPEAAEDIRKFFYAKLENAVNTLSSFPEEYSGGPDKIEPRIRKDFRDMAAWLPTLVTDTHGIATASVKLPDNLTTWRATVRGVTQDIDVGSALSKAIATQDLIVRLALPRFFTQYDRAFLTAIVHNYTDQPQNVQVTLKPSAQFTIQEPLVRTFTIKPDGANRYEWPVEVTHSGQGVVTVKAIGQTASDAMESRLPIRALGIEHLESASGVLKDDPASVNIPFKIPVGTDPRLATILLSVSASSIGPVLGSFNALIDYPYGCTEQTMSRLVPAVVALQLSKKLGIPMEKTLDKRFDAVAVQALAKLKSYHHDDGGWGWWQFDQSDAYLTAYVMEGLYLLKEAGYPIPDDSLPYHWRKDGVQWLKKASDQLTRQLNNPKIASDRYTQANALIDLSYVQYVLSLYDVPPEGKTRAFLLSRTGQATPVALGYETLLFRHHGDYAAARQSYAALNRLGDPASGMLNWDDSPRLQALMHWKDGEYSYRFTGVEATALALRATLAMEDAASPATDERLEAIERWLTLQRGQNGWDNTKTTALVLRAMMEKAVALGKGSDPKFTANSTLWRSAKSFSEQNLYAPEEVTQTTGQELSEQAIYLEKMGAGQLYYNALLSYMQALKPGDRVNEPAMPEGLQLRRAFYRIQAEPVGPEGQLRLRTSEITDHQVKAGETVLMKLIVESPVALPYILIDSAIPSGGEVVSNDPRENVLLSGSTSDDALTGDWGNWWWSHQDILDDRVALFVTQLQAGKSELYTLIRMEMPGTFQISPVRLEGMYSRKVHALSSLDELRVVQ